MLLMHMLSSTAVHDKDVQFTNVRYL